MPARLRLTLRRSTVGTNPSARGTVRALGLHRIGQTVELSDDVATRGQVRAVRYLLDVEKVAAPVAEAATSTATGRLAPKTSRTGRSSTSSSRPAVAARGATASSSRKEAGT